MTSGRMPTGDAEPNGTPYIYAFLLRRAADKSVTYVRRRLDDQGGIGTRTRRHRHQRRRPP